MKIAIDISQIVYGTGVSEYTRNLVEKLLEIDSLNNYILFAGSLRRMKVIEEFSRNLKGNFQVRKFPIAPTLADLIWNKIHILNIETLIGNVDVFHSSDWSQPPSSARRITTIHDLAPFKFPQLSHPRIVATQRYRIERVKKEIDHIIVPTTATKQDVVAYGIPDYKITVIPEAPDVIFKPANSEAVSDIKRKYRISGRYLLAVGANARKNTQRIILAFEKIKIFYKNLKLVVIGHPYQNYAPIRHVIFTGHVMRQELPAFYSGAEALVYPSIYEGFGLPVLEAMSCGIPVVTSSLSSLPEVSGNAAVLVDPYSEDQIADGIRMALSKRSKLVIKGFNRVRNFSWQKTAEATLKVYNCCT